MTDDNEAVVFALRSILAHVVRSAVFEAAATLGADPDPWVDLRSKSSPVSWRLAVAAAKRGELEINRVGRARLVRRSALDAWIGRPEHRMEAQVKPGKAGKASQVDHILRAHGYAPKGGGNAK